MALFVLSCLKEMRLGGHLITDECDGTVCTCARCGAHSGCMIICNGSLVLTWVS